MTKWSLNRGDLLIEVKCMIKLQLGHDNVVLEAWRGFLHKAELIADAQHLCDVGL